MTGWLARLKAAVEARLVADWRWVAVNAWSARLMLVAALLSGAEAALPLLDGVLPIAPQLYAALTLGVVTAAYVARIVSQKSKGD